MEEKVCPQKGLLLQLRQLRVAATLEEALGGGKGINSIARVSSAACTALPPLVRAHSASNAQGSLSLWSQKQERTGEEAPNSSARIPKSVSAEHLQKAPIPVAVLLKAQIQPEWMHRNRAVTAGSPLEQPASKQRSPPPSPPAAQGGGTHCTQLWSWKDPTSPWGRVTHLATAGSSCGAEYTQPMAGQGGGRQRVQGSCVAARGAVGGRV